jgi:hypothetical protein
MALKTKIQWILLIFAGFLFACNEGQKDDAVSKNSVARNNGQLSISSGTVNWFNRDSLKIADSLKYKITELFAGISQYISKDSFNIDTVIDEPYCYLRKANLDEDSELEQVFILGDQADSQLLLLVLDSDKHTYNIKFFKIVYCRYELPEVRFNYIPTGNNMLEVVERSGGSGISNNYHFYYRLVSGRIMEVLRLKDASNLNGTLKMKNAFDSIIVDSKGEIKVNYICKYWICNNFDEKIVLYNTPGEWESASGKICRQEDGTSVLDKKYSLQFLWNGDTNTYIADYSNGTFDKEKFEMLDNFDVTEEYAKTFIRSFKNDLSLSPESKTADWVYKRFGLK